jgi:hypothetical protein
MIDWSSHRGKLVTPEMLRELNRMSRRLEEIDRSHVELRDALRRKIEEDVSTEVIPVEITGTEVRDGVEVHAWREITTDDAPQDGGRSSDGYDENDDPDEFAFAATRPEESRAFVLRHQVAISENGAPLHEERYSLIETSHWILAEITDNAPMANAANRWEYDWREVEVTDVGSVQVKTDGLDSDDAGLAWNLCELVNTGSGIEGPGWNLATAPASFEIKPIDSCVVQLWSVRMSNGEPRWVFSMGNVLDGECEEEEGD